MQQRAKDYSRRKQFLWTDLPGAEKKAGQWFRRWKTPVPLLRQFIDEGYTISESAVEAADIETFGRDLDGALGNPASKLQMTFWDDTGHHYESATKEKLGNREAKVLDVHVRVPSSQNLIFAPPLLNFLRDVFQDEPLAFQTLYFENGSQQGAHQDTAFVYTDPPYHFLASWIALEDVAAGSGELFYYPGSQKLDDLIFSHGTKALPGNDPDAPRYSAILQEAAAAKDLKRASFLPKQSDVLFWASDLIHGGEPVQRPHTRRSLVTHYCPRKSVVPYAKNTKKIPERLANGGWVISQF
jgi:ectoine hydroxylase-related dioxygenase (phytanoyl-CoA dioxygenase family)